MKWFALVFLTSLVVSCTSTDNSKNKDKNPVNPQPSSPYNGEFNISATLSSWDCPAQPPVEEVPARVTITVEDDSITIADGSSLYIGQWDDTEKHGEAWGKRKCLPFAGCWRGLFSISFTSEDSLSGTYTVSREVVPQGQQDTLYCSETFDITGGRTQ